MEEKQQEKQEEQKRKGKVTSYIHGMYSKDKACYSFGIYMKSDDGEKPVVDSGVGRNVDALDMADAAGEIIATMRSVWWAKNRNYKDLEVHHSHISINRLADGKWKPSNPITERYVDYVKDAREAGLNISFVQAARFSNDEPNKNARKLATRAMKNASAPGDETDPAQEQNNE